MTIVLITLALTFSVTVFVLVTERDANVRPAWIPRPHDLTAKGVANRIKEFR